MIALGIDAVDPTVQRSPGGPAYDLYIDSTGQLVFHKTTALVVAQAVCCRLRTMLGEWYQDPSVGIDFVGQVLVKNPSIPTLQRYFATMIAKVTGVGSVDSVVCVFDSAHRSLQVNFKVTATDGTVVNGSV